MISGISSGGVQTRPMPSPQEMFERIDTNGDGAVDQTELAEMLESAPPPRMEGMMSKPPAEAERPDAAQLIEQFDADGDGVLSLEEATEMESMMAQAMQRQGELAPEWMLQDKEDDGSLSQYAAAALQTYSSQAASILSQSQLDTLG